MKKLLLVSGVMVSVSLFLSSSYAQETIEEIKAWGESSFEEAMQYSAQGQLQPFEWPTPPPVGQSGPQQQQSYEQQMKENYRLYLEREREQFRLKAEEGEKRLRYLERREELIRRQKELERQARQRRMQNAWTQFEFSQGLLGATQEQSRRSLAEQRERRERLAREGRQLQEDLERSGETVRRLAPSMEELRMSMERMKVLETSFRKFDREWKKELEQPDPELQTSCAEAMAVLEGDTVYPEYLKSWNPQRTLVPSEVPPPELPEETISGPRESMTQKVKRIGKNVKKNLVEIYDFVKTRETDEDFRVKMVKRTTERLKESPTLKVMIGGEVVTVPSDRPTRGTTESGVPYYFRPEERKVIPIIPGYLDINLIKTPRYSRSSDGVRG